MNLKSAVIGFFFACVLLISCGVAYNQNVSETPLDTKNGVVYNIYKDKEIDIVVYSYNGMNCASSFVRLDSNGVGNASTNPGASTSTSCVSLGR